MLRHIFKLVILEIPDSSSAPKYNLFAEISIYINRNRLCCFSSFLIFFLDKKKGVRIIVVGIGKDVSKEKMKKAAGSKEEVIIHNSYGELIEKLQKLIDGICSKLRSSALYCAYYMLK